MSTMRPFEAVGNAALENVEIDWSTPRYPQGRHVSDYDGFRITPAKEGDKLYVTIYRQALKKLRWDEGDKIMVGGVDIPGVGRFLAVKLSPNDDGYRLGRSTKAAKRDAGERPRQLSAAPRVGATINGWFDRAKLISREDCYVRGDGAIMIPLSKMYDA